MTSNRGALGLLSCYGDDSSDDDVPGPKVSVKRMLKDSDDEGANYSNKKVMNRLPLPSLITSSSQNNEHIDNPELHGGRVRSFRHARGNWVTYVFIPHETIPYLSHITNELKNILPNIDLQGVPDCHVSLTRTVILRHHWIDLFVASIKEKVLLVRKFIIMLGSLKVYCNEERTRTFIGCEAKTGIDSLLKLVNIMDECLSDFKLPLFYKDPSFHMSIMWCLGDKEEELNSVISVINEQFMQMTVNVPQEYFMIYVDNIQCKSGNKTFSFYLT